MMGWLTAAQCLPRWVVWGLLLTGPALWSRQFRQFIRARIGGDGGSS